LCSEDIFSPKNQFCHGIITSFNCAILQSINQISKNEMADKLKKRTTLKLYGYLYSVDMPEMCAYKSSLVLQQKSNFNNHKCLIFVLCCTYKNHICFCAQCTQQCRVKFLTRSKIMARFYYTSPPLSSFSPVKSQDNTKAYKDSESMLSFI